MKPLFFGLAFLLSFFVVAADRAFEVPPSSNTFFWTEQCVPDGGKPLQLTLDIPKGISVDASGWINRSFAASPLPCMVPVIGKEAEINVGGKPYCRVPVTFNFDTRGQVPLKPSIRYTLKMKLRYNFNSGFANLLLRTGDADSGLVAYSSPAQFAGQSDWQEAAYEINASKETYGVTILFHKAAGEYVDGTLDLASMKLYDGTTEIPLTENNFNEGTGGWQGPNMTHDSDGKFVRFGFTGKAVQAYTYTERTTLPAGKPFRSAPFLKIGDLADGNYPVYLSGGAASETITIQVRNRPAVQLKHMENAVWLAESPFLSHPTVARESTLATLKYAGFNTLYVEMVNPTNSVNLNDDLDKIDLHTKLITELAGDGFKIYAYAPFEMGFQGTLNRDYMAKYPDAASVDWKNRPAKRICPTHMMKPGAEYWGIYEKISARTVKESPLAGIYWDVETLNPCPSLETVQNAGANADTGSACFCGNCIERFKQMFGISDLAKGKPYTYKIPYDYANIPEPAKSIFLNYPIEWTYFVLTQTVWQVEQLRQAIQAVRPEAQMRVYTGQHTKGYWRFTDGGLLRWSEFCGVDRFRMAKVTDAVMGCHDLGYYPEIEGVMLKELSRNESNKTLPIILDVSIQGLRGELYKNLYARIMQIYAFCEADGLGLWGYWELDGTDMAELRRAFGDVAAVEDFLTTGRRLDSSHRLLPAGTPVRATTRLLGNKRAVFLINSSRQNTEVTLESLGLGPAATTRCRAVNLQGRKFDDPSKITLNMAADSVEIIIIEDISFEFGGK